MKKGTMIMLILICFVHFLYAKWEVDFNQKFTYNDNVFKLSNSDLKDYEDGNPEFNFIETSDDFIVSPSLKIGYEFKLNKRFSLTPSFKYSYEYYLKNNDKNDDSYLFSLATKTWIVNSNFSYGYYPKNYSRKYIDSDGTKEFEKYDYEKSMFKYTANFRINNLVRYFYYKYETLKFNQYFTEHDGFSHTLGFGLKYVFPHLYLKGMYYYKMFEADVHDDIHVSQINFEDDSLYLRDDSYNSNTYYLELRSKKIKTSKLLSVRPIVSFELENKFYQTDLPIEADPIHSTREETIMNVNFSTMFYTISSVDFTLKYSLENRDTTSDWSGLSKIKDYSINKIELGFSYKL